MFLDRFISYLKYEKNYSVHSISAYQHNLSTYIRFLESQDFDVITASHHQVRAFLAGLMESKLKPRSVNRCISSLKTFYKFLQREQLVEENPMLLIRFLKTPKPLAEVIQPDSIIRLLEMDGAFADGFPGMRDKLVIELLFGTGIRRAELLQISEKDVDFIQGTIRIFGKGSKERLVPMTGSLGESIFKYMELKRQTLPNSNTDRLIVTDKGKDGYAQFIYLIVTRHLALISSKQKKSPHILRHSIATALMNNGAQLNDIKELLGHANLASTQVYTHNSIERLKSIYKQAHPKG